MARLGPFLILTALTALFFAELLLSRGAILYSEHSDFISYHLPLKTFLVDSWQRDGEIPLWNPYWFAGSPFMQDLQVAVYYPFHWLLLALEPGQVGHGLSWLIVLHVLIAGAGAYLYARHRGLERAGSLVTAVGFMFSPKWMAFLLDAGFYMTIGFAWTPLMLLCFEKALERTSVTWAILAGGFGALLLLSGQPQWTLYVFVLVALWTLPLALETGSPGSSIPRWIGYLAVMAVTTGLVASVQLLPTFEAITQTRRGALDLKVPFMEELSLSLCALLGLVGESFTRDTPQTWAWELHTKLGVLWVLAAFLAPALEKRRVIRRQLAVTGLLAVGGILGGFLLARLPVFDLFRNHARFLTVLTFPLAFLGGVTFDRLGSGGEDASDLRPTLRRRLGGTLGGLVILVVAAVAYDRANGWALRVPPYWIFAAIAVATFGGLVLTPAAPWRRPVLGLLLLLDAWILGAPMLGTRVHDDVYFPSHCVQYVVKNLRPGERVLDYDLTGRMFYGPVGVALPLLQRFESLRGYTPLDVDGYRRFLARIADPAGNWDTSLLPNVPNLPLARPDLLDFLGVRFLVMPTDPGMRGFATEGPERWAGEPPWRNRPSRPWTPVFLDPQPVAYDLTAPEGVEVFPPYTVFENPAPAPRVRIVDASVSLEAPEPAPADPGTSVTITDFRPNRVTVRIDKGRQGHLVLADTWYPGWTCTVDGASRPVVRAHLSFRAVALEPQDREVVFTFAPRTLVAGRWLTVAGLFLLGFAAWSGLRYHVRRGT